jgi:hypothetical protein
MERFDVNELRTAKDWLENDHDGTVFPTFSSLGWFIRQNRARLIESGQFFPGVGRMTHMVGPEFGLVVTDILREKAANWQPRDMRGAAHG